MYLSDIAVREGSEITGNNFIFNAGGNISITDFWIYKDSSFKGIRLIYSENGNIEYKGLELVD